MSIYLGVKVTGTKGEYADVIGLVYDDKNNYVAAIYSDRSLFIWDIA